MQKKWLSNVKSRSRDTQNLSRNFDPKYPSVQSAILFGIFEQKKILLGIRSPCQPPFDLGRSLATAVGWLYGRIEQAAYISHTADLPPVLHISPCTPPKPSKISEKNWSTKTISHFDIPFMIGSHAESMKKIPGAHQDLPAN